MSKRYRVSFEIVLNDEAGHPRKWIPEAIWSNLNDGEDIERMGFEELPAAEWQDEDPPC